MSDPEMQNQIRTMMKSFKTKASIKWALILILGVFPMLLAWILFGGGDGTNKIFTAGESGNPIINISMGFQWLVALLISVLSYIVLSVLIKKNKDIKGDVYGNMIAFGWIVINFWLYPIDGWRWLTLPFTYIVIYIFTQIFRLFMFLFTFRKKAIKMQEQIRNGENPFKDKMTDEQFLQFKKYFDEWDQKFNKNNPNNKNKDDKNNNDKNNNN